MMKKTYTFLLTCLLVLALSGTADAKPFSKHSSNDTLVILLSEQAVKKLENAETPDLTMIPEDVADAVKVEEQQDGVIPMEMARYVVDRGIFAVVAEWCGYPETNNGYLTLMAEEKVSEKWSQEQLDFISQLHAVTRTFFKPRFENMPACAPSHKKVVDNNF